MERDDIKINSREYIFPLVMDVVEIELSTACNLYCFNCDRSCSQARSSEEMSRDQIAKFVNESIECNWNWCTIRILGGEPTLHSCFEDVMFIFRAYKAFNHECSIVLVTNGYSRYTRKVLKAIHSWITVENTMKHSRKQLFSPYNVASIDTIEDYESVNFRSGCGNTCGLGLTRYGFYCCGAGASVDRVFGFDIGIKSLKMISPQLLYQQRQSLCRVCGHYLGFRDIVQENISQPEWALRSWITDGIISPTWASAYSKYNDEPPQLSIYGV